MVNYLLSLSFIVAVGLYFKAKLNCYSQGCVCVCVCVFVLRFFNIFIILYVNCFGWTMAQHVYRISYLG